MPTNDRKSHVSIHINLTEYANNSEGNANPDETDVKKSPGTNGASILTSPPPEKVLAIPKIKVTTREVGIYESLTVASLDQAIGAASTKQKVYTGRRKHPTLWFLVCLFTPVIFFSAISYLPFYKYTLDSQNTANTNDASRTGWILTACMLAVWTFIILLTCLCARKTYKYFTFEKKTIPKAVFEKANDEDLDIVDWGNVEGPVKQLLHASIYAYCVKENEEKTSRTVRILSYSKSHWLTPFCFILGAIFLAGLVVLLTVCFMHKELSSILFLWIAISLYSIIPSALFSIGIFYKSVELQVIAEVASQKESERGVTKVQTLTIYTKYYPQELNGKLFSNVVRET